MSKVISFEPNNSDLISFFKQYNPFKELSNTEIEILLRIAKKVHYEKDELVFHEQDSGNDAFFVLSGKLAFETLGTTAKYYIQGDMFGEMALLDTRIRRCTVRVIEDADLFVINRNDLSNEKLVDARTFGNFYRQVAKYLTSSDLEKEMVYREMDVLLIQDGGCAPGYNSITAFLTQYLEQSGHRVFIASQGFKSVVRGETDDFNYLIYNRNLYRQFDHVPGVTFTPPLREARGADFRTERYKEFKLEENQKKAAENIVRRNVKILIGIGGNGTLAGIKSLAKFLPNNVRTFFIPVTIDSDVKGTECIGEHTGVEVGSEKIQCYMADARTHGRCYIIEMMGAEGGFHALHSCLGAGAHLAVLPTSNYDPSVVAEALKNRENTVMVVAEGYKIAERKANNYKGNAAEYFRDELLAAGLQTKQKIVCEGYSRDIRGALPNNLDIMLAQRMARMLSGLIAEGKSHLMPAVQGGKEYEINLDVIETDNSVVSDLAVLANKLGV